MPEVRDAVMRRWLISDILDAGTLKPRAPRHTKWRNKVGHETQVMRCRRHASERREN